MAGMMSIEKTASQYSGMERRVRRDSGYSGVERRAVA